MFKRVIILGTVSAVLLCMPAAAMDTAFSYQGRLSDAGAPATGDYDFQFLLYTAEIGGSQVGPIIYGDDVMVSNGFFTIYLDFGAGIFDGTNLWLEVSVRNGASTGSYTPLAPRQSILPSPYSLYSAKISWGEIDGMPPDFADGVDDDTTYAPGNQLDLAGDTFGVVEGSGSGLDADSIDGQDSLDFAPSAHTHSGAHITSGTVAEPRIDGALTRDSELMSIVLLNDGTGSTLDADLLDGNNSAAFAPNFAAGDGLDLVGGVLSIDPTGFNGSTPGGATTDSGIVSIAAGTDFTTIGSATISHQGTGYVLVVATAGCYSNDLDETNDYAFFSIGLDTDESGSPSYQTTQYLEWYGSAAGGYSRELDGVSTTGVFNVTGSGSKTFYARASTLSPDEGANCWHRNVAAIFVPN